MDFMWILVAFGMGFLAKQFGLPALLGYLIAGFGLHAYGVVPHPQLQTLADLGVTLLLFTVGLKLNVGRIFQKEVLFGAYGHMAFMVILSVISSLALGYIGVAYFTALDVKTAALVGFALSFSSTVVAVKVLEEKNELKTRHGQLTLAILVLQDIAAVVFMMLAELKLPSIYALGLLGLPFLRPVLGVVLQRSGHAEVLALAGFFMAFAGAWLFDLVGIKADLGALVFGMLLSKHAKANELSKTLLNFKDIFLIGFFMSIGFHALPTWEMALVALILTLSLPVKMALYFLIFTRQRLRARMSFLAATDLTHYSEFGLIVAAIGVKQGLLSAEWLVIVALAASFSFMLSGTLNPRAHMFYTKWKDVLKRFEHATALSRDTYKIPKEIKVLVIGMGRVGNGAYDEAFKLTDGKVWGVDVDRRKVEAQVEKGRHVIRADTEDVEFWESIDVQNLTHIMLALPAVYDILQTVEILRHVGYTGKITSIAKFEDDRQTLLDAGVDTVFNFYSEAGVGLAEETFHPRSERG